MVKGGTVQQKSTAAGGSRKYLVVSALQRLTSQKHKRVNQ
jgi:hypothetical protein